MVLTESFFFLLTLSIPDKRPQPTEAEKLKDEFR